MNSAERAGLKSICFESPGFHGTLSYTYRGQTLLLMPVLGLLLSSPHALHASSEYLAFCRASMSSVLSCPRVCNRTRLGRGHSASQDRQVLTDPLLWPRVPGSSRLKPVPHSRLRRPDAWRLLPFLHPEKMVHSSERNGAHSHTTSCPSKPTYLLNSCLFMKNPLSCRINEIL